MSGGFYNNNQRPFSGHIPKKPKLGPGARPGKPHGDEDGNGMLSFKEFVDKQSDDINELDALDKYRDYKMDFIRKRIAKFFKEHQEEEWFRNKYRPTEIEKIEAASKELKKKRKEVYKQLVEKRYTENLPIDYDHAGQVTKFLDDFSLLLEGATIEDLEDAKARKNFAVSAIFIRELHQSVDKSAVEEYAATLDGFLRVGMSEAIPELKFKRRAWITFKEMDPAALKQLTWDFNARKINGHEARAIMNKEMVHARYADHRFRHKDVAKQDLKNVAKLLTHFEGEDCPLLESIKEHLIEETNEEEKVLGVDEQNGVELDSTQESKLFKELDQAILYLRVVHSFDYYAPVEYVGEDDMPQKVGFMFLRPRSPDQPNNDDNQKTEFIKAHKMKIDSFLEKPTLSEIEQKQLGKKDPEEEVEHFIAQNTQERKKDEKYVCSLTGKKFQSAQYVRKHILNRCSDKLEEVRNEVKAFNNYVADPRRPM